MKDSVRDFFYFFNDKNYLKELSKQDNHKLLNEKINNKKKNFYLQIFLCILSIILLYNLLSFLFKFKINIYINYLIILLSICYYFIFNKVIQNFSNCYNYFIKLCEIIVKYDNIIKNKIKIKKYIQSIEEDSKNNIINIINILKKLINIVNNSNLIDYKNKNIIDIYKEYQKLKTTLFKFIFEEYEKEYITKEKYINKYINYKLYYGNTLNFKIQYLIIEFNKSIDKLNNEEIDYDLLIKQYEKYINDNVLKIEEIKKNEFKNKIYDLLISNFELNKKFIELIKEIDSNDINNNDEKINQIIEVIIEKKQLSISLLEQYKKKVNIDTNKNFKEENEKIKNDTDLLVKGKKFNNNNISLYDIQLGNVNYNKNKLNKKNNNDKNNHNFESGNDENYDIYQEQEKIKDLKMNFIDELNNYCKRVKGLNKNKENIENEMDKKENQINNKNKNENNINNNQLNDLIKDLNKNSEGLNLNKPQTKLDFAKSITLAFSKNKNFNLNFVGENNDDNTENNDLIKEDK